MKLRTSILTIVAILIAVAAVASVTFDANTGTGFVGKGDVQIAFNWNNAALQNKAAGVYFTYESSDSYSATCTWITGEGTRGERTHNVTVPRHTQVYSMINGTARSGPHQFTGFILNGFGTTSTSGEAPVVGGDCIGEGQDGTWTSVEGPVSSGGGLVVHYGQQSAPLAITPIY
jgi:hypothetical protein